MNNHTDPWEAEMSREFDQRVRDLHEAPLTFDHVKGKAMKIRRTRRVAAAGGILAAAAVIIPVAVFAGQGLTDNDSGPGPAETPTPNPTAIDPVAPGFGYLEGSTLHLADGSTVELPQRYDRATVLGDIVLAARNDDETGFDFLDVIDESGTAIETLEIVSGPVLNDDQTTVAYVERDGDLVTRSEGGDEQVIASDLGTNVFPVAVIGCGEGADSCRVYVDDGAEGAAVIDENGDVQVLAPDALGVEDANADGLATVQNDSQIDGSCGGIYDENAADYVWETCDYYLFDLSPDSKHVNATHPYLDGIGNGYAEILDAATGKPVGARFEPEEGFIGQTVWQDADHLLFTMYDAGGWSIYRLAVDGTTERLAGPSDAGDDTTPAYVLLGGS